MPDFHVVLQVELSLTARNEKQAWERGGDLTVELQRPQGSRWRLGDMDFFQVVQVEKLD